MSARLEEQGALFNTSWLQGSRSGQATVWSTEGRIDPLRKVYDGIWWVCRHKRWQHVLPSQSYTMQRHPRSYEVVCGDRSGHEILFATPLTAKCREAPLCVVGDESQSAKSYKIWEYHRISPSFCLFMPLPSLRMRDRHKSEMQPYLDLISWCQAVESWPWDRVKAAQLDPLPMDNVHHFIPKSSWIHIEFH